MDVNFCVPFQISLQLPHHVKHVLFSQGNTVPEDPTVVTWNGIRLLNTLRIQTLQHHFDIPSSIFLHPLYLSFCFFCSLLSIMILNQTKLSIKYILLLCRFNWALSDISFLSFYFNHLPLQGYNAAGTWQRHKSILLIRCDIFLESRL